MENGISLNSNMYFGISGSDRKKSIFLINIQKKSIFTPKSIQILSIFRRNQALQSIIVTYMVID